MGQHLINLAHYVMNFALLRMAGKSYCRLRPSVGRGCDRRKDHCLRPNIGHGCDRHKDHGLRPNIVRGCDGRKDHGLRPIIGHGCDRRKDHEMSLGWHVSDLRVITFGKPVRGTFITRAWSRHVGYIVALL